MESHTTLSDDKLQATQKQKAGILKRVYELLGPTWMALFDKLMSENYFKERLTIRIAR